MPSKTPQFDKAIDSVLNNLKPHEKVCGECKTKFQIFEEDIEFYKRFRVPPPGLCPDCRRQQRLAFLNYTTLYKRSCDVPDHKEEIISSLPEKVDFPVYDYQYYWSDAIDFSKFGKDYQKNSPFFDQFFDLFKKVPQPALTRDPSSINSDYTLFGAQLKDCYYVFGGLNSESSSYSNWVLYTKDSIDTLLPFHAEGLYESVFAEKSYNCSFAYFSKDCLDSKFIYDCRNCTSCFGCVNLRSKKFCFFNEQLTEEEYKKKMSAINLGDRSVLKEYIEKFWDFVRKQPLRGTRNEHSENVVGNYILNSKRCFMTFWIFNSENLRYTDFVMNCRDSMDFSVSLASENLYEIAAVSQDSSNVRFSYNNRTVRDSEYLINCRNCEYCFGCIGLRDKKYCIFNKQYEPDEYWKLVDEIKTTLLKAQEYGKFLPMKFNGNAYNGSLADIMFPADENLVKHLGGRWHEDKVQQSVNLQSLNINDVPADISQIKDDILSRAIVGEGSKKPFRIIKSELEFYRKRKLPIPTLHPKERMMARFEKVNNFKIVKDKCVKCKKEIYSGYPINSGLKPYCEQCYNSEII